MFDWNITFILQALQYFQKLKSERPGKAKAETIDEESISDEVCVTNLSLFINEWERF